MKPSESERGPDGRDDQTVASDRNEEDKEEKDRRNYLSWKVLESDIAKFPLTKQAELRFEPKRGIMITKRLIHVFKQS